MQSIGFIGAGTVGTALAVKLREKGYPVVAVASRTRASAERLADMVDGCNGQNNGQAVADVAEIVFITTPDDAIAQVAAQITWRRGHSVIHCSGAESVDILEPATKAGAQVGAFHPLQTLASVAHAIKNIPGSSFALEAEEPLLSTLKKMVNDLQGWWIELKPGDKVLYHAAAVIACNYLVTLVKLATDLWQTFGASPREATQALLPLLQGTVNNLGSVGLPNCLTGPIARGDLGTIQKHMAALEAKAPGLVASYRELGRQTIPIAVAKGKIGEQRAEELRKLFNHN
ncbi:MAG: F420-dependent NADP oxidoreductase [Chloroflexi bacterium RBG_13_54_8]|nr:MAG: F420-dependent NADP oxidoreductase [Chloroflexi bacterium RBG_13_54_8]